jgi:cell pole-organizing protein PopZ
MSKEKHNDDKEMSMEEILASIRRYVADDTPETNNQEGGIDYSTGKTADVIRLTEALDASDATLETEQQTQKTDLSSASLKPKDEEIERKISAPSQQRTEQNYAHNPKIKPFIAPTEQRPVHTTQYPTTHNQPMPQQAAPQPMQQQYSAQQYDPLQTYGEQIAPQRTYQTQQMQPQPHYTQPHQTNHHHYGQANSMDYSRQQYPHTQSIHRKPSIVSEPTISSAENAFSKLTQAFQFAHNEKKQAEEKSAVYGTSAIESFVIEMARPMIREWIDKHLPQLVDKLVTQEIEKLTEDLRKKLL